MLKMIPSAVVALLAGATVAVIIFYLSSNTRNYEEASPHNYSSSQHRTTLMYGDEECCICFSPLYHPTQPPVKLRCGHVFHSSCINTWRNTNSEGSRRCPLCRCSY